MLMDIINALKKYKSWHRLHIDESLNFKLTPSAWCFDFFRI